MGTCITWNECMQSNRMLCVVICQVFEYISTCETLDRNVLHDYTPYIVG
jgi:hypothetical protein